MNNFIWTTKNNEKIPVNALSTFHIINILKCIDNEDIKFGHFIDIGYTADGDGDGIIYEWFDNEKEEAAWYNILNDELEKRANE